MPHSTPLLHWRISTAATEARAPHLWLDDFTSSYATLAGHDAITPLPPPDTLIAPPAANLVAVAAMMGHQRLEATAIYTTPSASDLEKAVDRLTAEEASKL